jgi:hypothetical protein
MPGYGALLLQAANHWQLTQRHTIKVPNAALLCPPGMVPVHVYNCCCTSRTQPSVHAATHLGHCCQQAAWVTKAVLLHCFRVSDEAITPGPATMVQQYTKIQRVTLLLLQRA